MSSNLTVGLISQNHETGEKRDFLPDFVHKIRDDGWTVLLEKAYGQRMGLTENDYAEKNIKFATQKEVKDCPVLLTLRYPGDELVKTFKKGTLLISMLHFPTREERVRLLTGLGIKAIALDQIMDDDGKRLVENLKSVAWNGIYSAFEAMQRFYPKRLTKNKLIKATIIGSGNIGKFAADAAIKLGNHPLKEKGIAVMSQVIGRSITGNKTLFEKILKDTDILVDATERNDTTKPIVNNEQIALLPGHTVLVDLCVDPYIVENKRVLSVKGIEGIPQGNLDQWIFPENDPAWDQTPTEINKLKRRTTVSCYSWPGVFPEECMKLYGKQVVNVLNVLKNTPYEKLSFNGDYFGRSVYRGSLKYFLDLK